MTTEVYVTLEEAAELEGIEYGALRVRIFRDKSKYKTKTEKSPTGGKDKVFIALTSLSKKARREWKAREELKALAVMESDDPELPADRPWYTAMDVDWFIEKYPEKWYKAMEVGNVVREALDYKGKNKTQYMNELAEERLGKKWRTLYKQVQSYLEASAWADRMHKEDGGDYEFFKVLALCRKPKDTMTFPSCTPEVKQVIKNIWFNKEFAANHSTKEMLYEKLQAVARVNKWDKIPSYQTVVRYINYLMEDEGMRNAWYLAAQGERQYKNAQMQKRKREIGDMKVMEVVMGDEHTFDFWVAYDAPNGKTIAIRPKLVAWIDIRSRMIIGDVMCQYANTDILKQSMLKMMYHDVGSVPMNIYVDNGADYVAKEMTGRHRYDRGGNDGYKEIWDIELDDAAKGFYKSMGIEDIHRALPYYAWVKGNIERFFGTVCNKFSKWFTSYTGTLTGSKTSEKIDKDIKRMLERGELLTLDECYEKWQEWLKTVYEVGRHRTLYEQESEPSCRTPIGCFENAERYMRALPPKNLATMLLLKNEKRTVRNIGIKLMGGYYMSQDLAKYINGKPVDVKYDPYDLSTIYVFRNGKQICEAYRQEALPFAMPNGEEPTDDMIEHFANEKNQLKEDREILKEANKPYDKMYPGLVGFDGMGGLMIGKKPKNNVVQMPTDNTYRNGFRGKNNRDDDVDNEYISKQGEEAAKTLRAL